MREGIFIRYTKINFYKLNNIIVFAAFTAQKSFEINTIKGFSSVCFFITNNIKIDFHDNSQKYIETNRQ